MKIRNKYTAICIILICIIICLYGCFKQVNKHKSFINMILEYYPEQKITIIESDPNRLIIKILKGDK